MPTSCGCDIPVSKPVLVVIGADSSLRERIGAVSLPFALQFRTELPRERRLGEAAIVHFPEGAILVARAPRRYPVMGYGSITYMEEAFARGVADYLAEPWSVDEFRLRAERVLGTGTLVIKDAGLTLCGFVLVGPKGEIRLSAEQAAVLRQLIIAEGYSLSRGVFRRYLWPSLPDSSRVVDATISRLRRQLASVSGNNPRVQLRSVRGIGYSLLVMDALCESCG
jgi:hypothetical protein